MVFLLALRSQTVLPVAQLVLIGLLPPTFSPGNQMRSRQVMVRSNLAQTTFELTFFILQRTKISSLKYCNHENLTNILKNGTELPLKLYYSSDVKYNNGQQYYSYGDAQFLTSGISSIPRSSIELHDEIMGTVMTFHVYPLAISLLTEPISRPNITFEANIPTVYGSRIVLGEKEVFALESRQNGTSLFKLSLQGNFGSGTTEHLFAAELYPPFPDLKGRAFAKAVNGALVEFDERFTFTHHDQDHALHIMDSLLLETDYPIVQDLRGIVLCGLLSLEMAGNFLIQSQEFEVSVESNPEVMLMTEEDGKVRRSPFPSFRIDIGQC